MAIEKFDSSLIKNVFLGNLSQTYSHANIERYNDGYAWLLEIDFPYSDIVKERWSEDMKSVYYSKIDTQIGNSGGYNVSYFNEDFQKFITEKYNEVLPQHISCYEKDGIPVDEFQGTIDFEWIPDVYLYLQYGKKSYNTWHHHQRKGRAVTTCFYLNVPKEGGNIDFRLSCGIESIKPKENKLYVFPSWQLHMPTKQKDDEVRFCINADFYTPKRPYIREAGGFW
jgi:hypothetical protein